jgi:hypothetical protein
MARSVAKVWAICLNILDAIDGTGIITSVRIVRDLRNEK